MRIKILQEQMLKEGITVALIMYHRDLFYYAGTAQPCNLLIPVNGEPVLFVRRAMDFVIKETWIENIENSDGLGAVFDKLEKMFPGGGKLGLEEDVLPASLYKSIVRTFPKFQPVNISPLIMRQRSVKEPVEIEKIRAAADLFSEAHNAVIENLRPGVSEIELASEVYRRVRRAGADFTTFHRRWDNTSTHEGLIAGSGNSWKISGLAMTVTGVGTGPAMPWGASPEKLSRGDLLVMDIGINRAGYHADMARTYVVGKADEIQKERFQIVNNIMETVLAAISPGISAGELFAVAETKAAELNVADYFQGWGDMKGFYIGHGVGLEIDDFPVLIKGNKEKLLENMVVSIEPKIIIPEWGAIDLEDTVVIKKGCPEILTPVSRQLYEVI